MKKISLFKKIWMIAKPFKYSFILSYTVLLIELVFNQIMPLFLANVINAAVYKTDMKLFFSASLFYMLVFIGYQACGFIQLQLWQVLNNKYVYNLRVKCYDKILNLKAKTLSDIKTGDMLQIINGDTMEFHHIIQRYAMRIVNAGIGTVVSLIIIAFLKWEIALIVAILIPASVLLTNKIKKKMKSVSEEIRNKQGSYNSWLMEIFKGFREIKLFAAEQNTSRIFTDKNKDLIDSNIKQVKLQFGSEQIINLIYFVSQIIFYIICAFFVADKSIDIGEYVAIAAYYTMVSGSFQRILRDNMQFQSRQVSVERVFRLLENDYENETDLIDIEITKGEISINELSFAYKENLNIIKNLNYTINSGEKIGVAGESGVGKSTLAHIFIKLFAPDKGSVIIDGQDLKNCSYHSVRKNIGIVSQDTIIFDGSVKDNICFDKNVSDDVIWETLDKAYLKAEIERLPDGLNTTLGKDGINLSGGQNQRLAIARMLYKNPKIVILDEATSALDEDSEKIVQKALDQLTKGRTSIVISHRLNSIINADRILVLQDGEIVGDDSYDKLIKSNSAFISMFSAQAKRLEAASDEI
jgi:ABC-type multidrug transport system fused ATPase/permease subunit